MEVLLKAVRSVSKKVLGRYSIMPILQILIENVSLGKDLLLGQELGFILDFKKSCSL